MIRISYIFILMTAVAMNVSAQVPTGNTVRQEGWAEDVPMNDETVEWRQDVYREIPLCGSANAGLYSPSDQEGATTGLFAHLLELAIKGKINLYKYEIDGDEKLTQRNKVSIKSVLDDYHFTYTEDSMGCITINKNDIPYADVAVFYLKEAMYYDIVNSSFHRKVVALCPVIILEDEVSEEKVRYPLFWTKYEEVEKYLHNVIIRPESHNTATRMSMADFFTLNRYMGEIYKIYNPYSTVLSQYCENDSSLAAERKKIEQYYGNIRNITYNPYYGLKNNVSKDDQ